MTDDNREVLPQLGRRGIMIGGAATALVGTPALAADSPKRGGTLTMARVADVVSFEPVQPSDNMSIWAKLLVFQLLARTNPAGTGVVPDLAEKWEISPDKRTYTFHIRPAAKFSDGTQVTADDVEFSFIRVTAKDSPWNGLYPKFTMTKPDSKTIVFHLGEDYAPFMAAVSLHGACIVPKAYFSKLGPKAFGEKPMGSGPFVMTEWKKGNAITMDRNPHFWDPTRPYLDQVILSIVADDNVRMLQVESGAIDIGTFVPFNQIAKLKKAAGLEVQVAPYDRIDWLQFNTKKPQFTDVKVRQALNYAINKEAIIKSVLFGYGEVPTSFMPKMLMTDLTQKPYTYDLAKAKQLMAASNQPNGFSATLTTVSGDVIGNQVAQIVQQMVLPLKIKLKIEQLEGDTQYSQIQTGEYEMAEGYMTSDTFDPDELVSYAALGNGGSHAVWTYYNNDEVNKLAAEALREFDVKKRAELYKKLQEIVFHDAPYVWLYWTPSVTAVRDDVKGFRVLPTGNYWLEDVWKV